MKSLVTLLLCFVVCLFVCPMYEEVDAGCGGAGVFANMRQARAERKAAFHEKRMNAYDTKAVKLAAKRAPVMVILPSAPAAAPAEKIPMMPKKTATGDCPNGQCNVESMQNPPRLVGRVFRR
jgi:hypothetical protein